MSDCIFVSFEGLPPTVSDSQFLIHIEDMRSKGINIDLWIFCTKKKIYNESYCRLNSNKLSDEIRVLLFRGIPPIIPFSAILNGLIFAFYMKKFGDGAKIVHARTDYATVICGIFKKLYGYTLILDRRGDALAEFTSKYSQRNIFRKLASPFQRFIIEVRKYLANRFCDKAIFVSEKLKEKSPRFYKPYQVIPCTASSKLFFFNDSLREKTRKILRFHNSNRVIVFSGSLSNYQIFDKCVKMFQHMSEVDESLMLLVVTPYVKEAKEMLLNLPSEKFRLISSTISDVNSYLNAADFGLFLREIDELNYVASPVKFAEYCLAGLPIIMTGAVEQSTNLSKILKNGIYFDFISYPQKLDPFNCSQRLELSAHANKLLSRDSVLQKYLEIYRLI
jgi:hypothetical protein